MIIDRERETYYALCFTLPIDDHRHMTRIMYRGRVMMIIDRESETKWVLCFTFAIDDHRHMTPVMCTHRPMTRVMYTSNGYDDHPSQN